MHCAECYKYSLCYFCYCWQTQFVVRIIDPHSSIAVPCVHMAHGKCRKERGDMWRLRRVKEETTLRIPRPCSRTADYDEVQYRANRQWHYNTDRRPLLGLVGCQWSTLTGCGCSICITPLEFIQLIAAGESARRRIGGRWVPSGTVEIDRKESKQMTSLWWVERVKLGRHSNHWRI